LELANCGCPPRLDDLRAKFSFLAAGGRSSPTFGLAIVGFIEPGFSR